MLRDVEILPRKTRIIIFGTTVKQTNELFIASVQQNQSNIKIVKPKQMKKKKRPALHTLRLDDESTNRCVNPFPPPCHQQ